MVKWPIGAYILSGQFEQLRNMLNCSHFFSQSGFGFCDLSSFTKSLSFASNQSLQAKILAAFKPNPLGQKLFK